MREPWLVLVPTWARADGLCGTPDMSPALNYKALLYATPTHLPSICPFTRPHVIISALSMHLPPVLWAWIRAPATHFLGARILTTLPLSIPPAAFSALPQHLPSPFSVIILSSQYLFQRGPIWFTLFALFFTYLIPQSVTKRFTSSFACDGSNIIIRFEVNTWRDAPSFGNDVNYHRTYPSSPLHVRQLLELTCACLYWHAHFGKIIIWP